MYESTRTQSATTDDVAETLRVGDNVYYKLLNSGDKWLPGEIKDIQREHGRTQLQILGDRNRSWNITTVTYDPKRIRKMTQFRPFERTLPNRSANYETIKNRIPRRPPRVEEKRVGRWTSLEVASWLKQLGVHSRPSSPRSGSFHRESSSSDLPVSTSSSPGRNEYSMYLPSFISANVHGTKLLSLTREDMHDLGITSPLHRSEILQQIAKLRNQMERIEDALGEGQHEKPETPQRRSYTMEDFEAKHQEIVDRYTAQSPGIYNSPSPVPQTSRYRRAGYMLRKLRTNVARKQQAAVQTPTRSPSRSRPGTGPNSRRGSAQTPRSPNRSNSRSPFRAYERTPPPPVVEVGDTVSTNYGDGKLLDKSRLLWVVRLGDGRVVYKLFKELSKWTIVDVSMWCGSILGGRFRAFSGRLLLEKVDGTQVESMSSETLKTRIGMEDTETRNLFLDELRALRTARPIRIRHEWHDESTAETVNIWRRQSAERNTATVKRHRTRNRNQSTISEFSLLDSDVPDFESSSTESEEEKSRQPTRSATFPRQAIRQRQETTRSTPLEETFHLNVDDTMNEDFYPSDEDLHQEHARAIPASLFEKSHKRYSQNLPRHRQIDYDTAFSPPRRAYSPDLYRHSRSSSRPQVYSPPTEDNSPSSSPSKKNSLGSQPQDYHHEHSRTRSSNPSDHTSLGSAPYDEQHFDEDSLPVRSSVSKEAVLGSLASSQVVTPLYQSPNKPDVPRIEDSQHISMIAYGLNEDDEHDDFMDLGSVIDTGVPFDDDLDSLPRLPQETRRPKRRGPDNDSYKIYAPHSYDDDVAESEASQPIRKYSMGQPTGSMFMDYENPRAQYDDGVRHETQPYDYPQSPRRLRPASQPMYTIEDPTPSAHSSLRSSRRSSRQRADHNHSSAPSSRRRSSGARHVGHAAHARVAKPISGGDGLERPLDRPRSSSSGRPRSADHHQHYEHNSIHNLRRAQSNRAFKPNRGPSDRRSRHTPMQSTGQAISAPRPTSRKAQDNDHFLRISDMFQA